MRRDRTGEPIDEDADADVVDHATWCGGWLDRDRAIPCSTCRPWLAEHRPPTAAELDAARRRMASAS